MLATWREDDAANTFRSSRALYRRAGRWLFQTSLTLAFSSLLAGCAPPAAQAPVAAPASSVSHAAKNLSLAPYSIHLLAGGAEMELAGDMPEGTTAAVQKMLDANPAIRVIHLNSNGGELREGYRLSQLIKQRHLTTYTSATCASACTVAFLAGTPRYLANGAWLGFHSSFHPGSEESSPEGNAVFYRMYQSAGLPDDFIKHVLTTKPSEIWYPTHEELVKAHVVDHFVDNQKFAKSGIAYWRTATEVDQALQDDDLYMAIAAHDPAAYTQIRNLYLTGARLGRRIVDIDDDASSVVMDQFLPHYIKKATDQPVLRYQRAYAAKFEFLTHADPKACAAESFPGLGYQPTDYMHEIPQSIKQEMVEALADITNSAFDEPHVPDSSGQVYMAETRYFRHLNQASPDTVNVIDRPNDFRDDPTVLCRATMEFYKHVLDQPTADAAIIARDFLGENS